MTGERKTAWYMKKKRKQSVWKKSGVLIKKKFKSVYFSEKSSGFGVKNEDFREKMYCLSRIWL